jgi:hypothetical protein
MDPRVHKRFLDYRELHAAFGSVSSAPPLLFEAFAAAEAEQTALEAKGEDGRTDEEEARYVELTKLLHRD